MDDDTRHLIETILSPTVTFTVGFPELGLAVANQEADRLLDTLRAKGGSFGHIEVKREDPTTLDAGSILAITLAAPAVVEVTRGLRDYIAAWGNSIVIKGSDGMVVARGTAAQNIDAAAVAAALTKSHSTTR
jgi:hypothetical protein